MKSFERGGTRFPNSMRRDFKWSNPAPVPIIGEAKALVDGAPSNVLEGANKETAEKAKAQLEEAGATVTLK